MQSIITYQKHVYTPKRKVFYIFSKNKYSSSIVRLKLQRLEICCAIFMDPAIRTANMRERCALRVG